MHRLCAGAQRDLCLSLSAHRRRLLTAVPSALSHLSRPKEPESAPGRCAPDCRLSRGRRAEAESAGARPPVCRQVPSRCLSGTPRRSAILAATAAAVDDDDDGNEIGHGEQGGKGKKGTISRRHLPSLFFFVLSALALT